MGAPGKAELNMGDWLETAHIQDSAVSTAKIASDAVTIAKTNVFQSETTTGAGSATVVAHGLSASPAMVQTSFMSIGATPATISATADATNLYVVTEATSTFKAIAWV